MIASLSLLYACYKIIHYLSSLMQRAIRQSLPLIEECLRYWSCRISSCLSSALNSLIVSSAHWVQYCVLYNHLCNLVLNYIYLLIMVNFLNFGRRQSLEYIHLFLVKIGVIKSKLSLNPSWRASVKTVMFCLKVLFWMTESNVTRGRYHWWNEK